MMNKENPVFHRDQIQRPNFHKFVNQSPNGFSSPFPFMEFGLSSQSSLNNLLHNFSRLNGNVNGNPEKRSIISDPYLKPLSLDRLKSTSLFNRENNINNNNSNTNNNNNPLQYGHNFIKLSSKNLKTNDFSDNVFLRLQSTRTDNSENLQRKLSNDLSKPIETIPAVTHSNDKLIHKIQPTTVLTPNSHPKKDSILTENVSNFSGGFFNDNFNQKLRDKIRPTTAAPVITDNSSSINSNRDVSAKYYVKSYKTDALIYNPNRKPSLISQPNKSSSDGKNTPLLFQNSKPQSLYLQVKQEVEEYRKQRRKEAMLDIDVVYSDIKPVSNEELFANANSLKTESEPAKIKQIQLKIPETQSNATTNIDIVKREKDKTRIDLEMAENEQRKSPAGKSLTRPKSVTFNETVETRDFFDDSSSSESDNEESNDASSTDNESRGSIVSTDSESEDTDQISEASPNSKSASVENVNQNESSTAQTKESKVVYDSENLVTNDDSKIDADIKINDETESSDEDNDSDDNLDSDSSSYKSDSENEKVDEKSSRKSNSQLSGQSILGRTGSVSNSNTTSPSSSVTQKSQNSSEKSQKRSIQGSKGKGNSCLFKQDLLEMNAYKETRNQMPLIFSKFSNVPPVINFVGDGEKIEQLPWQLRKLLRWRTSLLTPVIVKQTISRSGFRPSRYTCSGDDLEDTESNDWILYFGKHMKGPVFKTIKEYQKVNHFPGSFQLGRKDRLWRNIYRMQQEVGNNEFDFIPQTFCLPTDLELFKQCWESGGNKHKWIIKPPASARGIGVKVVYKWNQIPKRRPVIVQRYIANPYLINDSKFDLRLYVFIADINPLRIYLYDDGLVRFASTKYSNSVKTLHNRFVHLTNYSINKQNIEYMDNNDTESCKGHKWSVKSLWKYLKRRGINTDTVWSKIKDLVVKTIISAEEAINASVNVYCKTSYSVQELFGFDVILDENLKPWILEVNVSPSLHSDSPLDVIIKGGMIKDMLNLSGFILPEPMDVESNSNGASKSPENITFPTSDLFIDRRFWIYETSEDEKAKMKHFVSVATNGSDFRFDHSDNIPYQILDCLTPKDVRLIIQCLDEYERRGHFERIYPLTSVNASKRYLSYFERIHYGNLLIAAFLTKYNRNNQGIRLIESLCQKKLHLLSAQNGDKIDGKHVWRKTSSSGDNY